MLNSLDCYVSTLGYMEDSKWNAVSSSFESNYLHYKSTKKADYAKFTKLQK